MRAVWSILAAALLALLVFWLWPEGNVRSTLALPPSEPPGSPRAAEPLASAEAPEKASKERVGVTSDAAEPTEPVTPESDEQLRVLRGRVIDAESLAPIAGFELELMQRFGRDAPRLPVTTDAQGTFEIELVPGEHLALHVPDPGDPDLSFARALQPQVFELPGAPDAGPHELTLEATSPPGMLEVDVSYEDGRPAVGAWALFDSLNDAQYFVDLRGRVDESGRVRLGVWEIEDFTEGVLRAWDEDGHVSEYLPIEAPFVPGVRRLVLSPGAQVEVVVRDSEQQPVVGRRILLASELTLGQRIYQKTDEAGRTTFAGIVPGAYAIGVWRESSNVYQMEELEVVYGERRTLEFELEENEQLAAARGKVVDEDGSPLSGVTLIVTPAGGWPGDVKTNDGGEFVFFSEPCDSILIQSNVWAEGDVYEPADLRVSHGTADVLFTRVQKARTYDFEVEVYDLVTGEAVEHFAATIDRGPGTEQWANSYAPRRSFLLLVLDDSRWRVSSHGYLVRTLELKKELDALPEGERLRVGLEPGLDHSFIVRDADDLEPLEGVLFRSESAGEVRSDAQGRVHLRSDHWSTYQVSREGYEPDTWDPDDYVLWAWGPLLLVREEDG